MFSKIVMSADQRKQVFQDFLHEDRLGGAKRANKPVLKGVGNPGFAPPDRT